MNARRVRQPGLVVGAALMVTLAGCATGQAPKPAANVQAQKPDYGLQLTPKHYAELVVGNTLFRPLQDGGTTVIYVAPDQSLKLRIQTPSGRILTDTGHETLEPGKVCWQWAHAGNDCFVYYWSGRIMTFVPTEGSILPAQFLVQKGNAEGL